MQDDQTLHLRNPRDIKAFAHPARMAIVDALATGDELTATDCARLTGLSPSATAYHLKFLERYGFAEPAPARKDGRERPWRATERRTSIDFDTSTSAAAEATTAVIAALFDGTRAIGEKFIATERDQPEEWKDAASLANGDLWLTADEVRELVAIFTGAREPYRDRTLADRPKGARRVRVMSVVVPHPPNAPTKQ